MDGTLVDSEPIWQAALCDLAAVHGGTLSSAARRALVGTTTSESMEILYRDIGQPWHDHEAGGRWLERHALRLFAGGVTWRPGARELLAAVRAAGLRTALVTATIRPITEAMLDTMGRSHFDVVVTDDDVENGKPDPEPYARAAAALGVPPSRCVAIEDSPVGCASAVAAGCAVLAVHDEVDLSGTSASAHVRSLDGIDVAFLRALRRRYSAGAAGAGTIGTMPPMSCG